MELGILPVTVRITILATPTVNSAKATTVGRLGGRQVGRKHTAIVTAKTYVGFQAGFMGVSLQLAAQRLSALNVAQDCRWSSIAYLAKCYLLHHFPKTI